MIILMERPWTTDSIAFYARHNGRYDRPIIGSMVDFRIEDIIPANILTGPKSTNILGKLPDISSAHQIDRYLVSIYNDVRVVDEKTATKYASTNDFVILPDNPTSKYWKYTHAPWWEFVTVLDEYQGYIKAPKDAYVRSGEPTPEQADELLDKYEVNQNKLRVLAPTTLQKMIKDQVEESYIVKLRRI